MSQWELYSPPPPPLIVASFDYPAPSPFNSDAYNFYLSPPFRTWTNVNANLTIALTCVLNLLCIADYPVSWFWQDEENSKEHALPLNSALVNGVWILHKDSSYHYWTNSSTYKIPVTDTTYQPHVKISPVIESMPKIYICRSNKSTGLNSGITIRLLIDSRSRRRDYDYNLVYDYDYNPVPPQILCGFDRIAPTLVMDINDYGRVVFLCFLPRGHRENVVRLIMPDGTTIDVPEYSGTSGVGGVVVSREWKKESQWNLNVVFTSAPKGLYRITIGTVVNYSFEYVRPMYQTVRLRRKYEHFYGTAYLGEIYEARLFDEGTFDTGEVELVSHIYEKKCQTSPVPANRASSACGILALQAFQGTDSDNRSGIAIIVNATNSCSILGRLMRKNRNSKPIESFLDLTVREMVSSYPESMVVHGYLGNESNFISSGKVIPSNETVTLSCVFPICTFGQIYLCKSGLSNRFDSCITKETKEEGRPFYVGNPLLWKGTMEHHLYQISNHTLAFDVKFPAIAKTHSGTYECAGEHREETVTAQFDIKVEDPSPPRIKVGNSGQVVDRWIERGQDTLLTCEVDGFPDPDLLWFEEDGSKMEVMEKYYGKTSIPVNKSGNFICMAKNKMGRDDRKFRVQYLDGISVTTISAIIVPTIVIIILAITIAYFWRQHAKSRLLKRFNALFDDPADTVEIDSDRPLNDQTDILSFERKYEINRDQFVLTKEIGHGQFGQVFKGELTFNTDDIKLTVAIKSPKDPENLDQYRDLLSEYKIMTCIRPHVNIVSLLGVCRLVEGKNFFLYVLTEFCGHGSLEAYLIKHWSVFENFSNAAGTADSMESSTTLLGYAYQAARGMRHLALHKVIHRDLALRNLLLTQDHVVKIADFGMSRRHETVYKTGFGRELLPIYWMAPESLNNREYSEKSDVWSFGVVLWEMFTCATPYQDQDIDGLQDLLWWIQSGNRLSKPQRASQELYKLMLDCWHNEASARPEFRDCKQRLGEILGRKSTQMYSMVKQKLYAPTLMPNSNQCQQVALSQSSSIDETQVEDTTNTVPVLDLLFVETDLTHNQKEPIPYAERTWNQ